MELSSLLTTDKTIKVEHPDYEGFIIELAYMPKDTLIKIRKRCATHKFDKKTRGVVEDIDEDKFLDLYISEVIKGWTGLRFEYLKEMVVLDTSKLPAEGELEYTPDNAKVLMTNASDFDAWVTTVIGDVENFNKSV